MTDGLVAFLRARLTDDERTAQAAVRYHGHWLQGFGPAATDDELYEVTQAQLDAADGCDGEHPIGSPNQCEWNALLVAGPCVEADPQIGRVTAHIARHDPARVLAEVATKRKLIDEVLAYEACIDGEWGCDHNADAIALGRCPEHQPDEIPALRLLAAPYADHDDYQQEWTP